MAKIKAPPFVPPGTSLTSRRIAHLGVPAVRRHWAMVDEVIVPRRDQDRIRRAFDYPSLICPNHPSLAEPSTVFGALDGLGLWPHYLMDREVFDAFGPVGPVLTAAGAYTIRRGVADRQSMACTKRLLTAGASVVAYPEGETYGLNDTLLPFQVGLAQFGFWAATERAERHRDPEVLLLPLAVKYIYGRDMRTEIDTLLADLEERYQVAVRRSDDRIDRIEHLIEACVAQWEGELQPLPDAPDLDVDARLARCYETTLTLLNHRLGLDVGPAASRPEQLRRLFAAFDRSMPDPQTWDAEAQAVRDQGYAHLVRMQRLQALYHAYVREYPSAERMLDVLCRLEMNLSGRWVRFNRTAHLAVGNAVSLGSRLAHYRIDKRSAVATATSDLRTRLRRALDGLLRLSTPLGTL